MRKSSRGSKKSERVTEDDDAILQSAMDSVSSAFEKSRKSSAAERKAIHEEREAMLAEFEAKEKAMLADFEAKEKAMLAEIEAKEKAVEEDRSALEAEKEAMKSHDTSDTDIIEVNVSGTHIDVSRRTLCQIEGSLLASQFSGRWWEDNMKKDTDDRVFLDYDADEFKLTLKELRRCQLDPEHVLEMPTDPSLAAAYMEVPWTSDTSS